MNTNHVDPFKVHMKWLRIARHNPNLTSDERKAIMDDTCNKAMQNEGRALNLAQISDIVDTANDYWNELIPTRNL